MLKLLLKKQRHAIWQRNTLCILLPIFVLITTVLSLVTLSMTAEAATSSTLTFQGRLASNTGSLVPDGSYNIEFKLYNAAVSAGSTQGVCTGDVNCLWTETHLTANPIEVVNGYFSVNLGDAITGTPFPAINWDQELWLGMNVGGSTVIPAWDGEMTPRFKLTAVPYAFRAGALVDGSGNAKDADDFAQLAPSSVQSINAAVSALRLNQTGSGSLLEMQGDGSNVFTVSKTGAAVLGAGITVGNSSSTTAGTIRWSGADLEVYNGLSWVSLTAGGNGPGGTNSNTSSTFISSVVNLPATATGRATGLLNFTAANAVASNTGSNTFIAPADGSFRSCVVIGNANSTAGTATLRWSVNDASVGSGACVIDGTNIRTSSTTVDPGIVTFNAGDTISVVFDSNSLAPITTEYTVYWTVEYDSSAVSSYFANGGNEFGGTAVLGTNDAFGLNIITNGNTVASISAAGSVAITNDLTVSDGLVVSNGFDNNSGGITEAGAISGVTSIASSAGLTIQSGGAGDLTLDSASGLLLIDASILRRSAAGTTTVDLLDTATTTLSLTNSNGSSVANLLVEGSITGASFVGNGSGITALNGGNISTGTIDDARLSSNVMLLDQSQTLTGVPTYSAGLILGNSSSTTAGALRWSGTDFEGYDGVEWVSFTTGGLGGGPGSSSPALTTVTKTVNETVTTSTALQDDDHLSFTMGANETWSYRFVLQANSPVAAGIKFAVTAPSGATCQVSFIDQQTASSESNVGCGVASAVLTGTGANEVYEVVGSVTTAATAGVVRLQWAQGTASGTTTVLAGSNLNASINGGGMVFLEGGNSFGSTAILGSKDSFSLNLIAGNTTALSLSHTDSSATFTGLALMNGGATIGNASTDGFTIVSDSVALTNGLKFDTDTFVIDAGNDRVGIGTLTPDNLLSINDAATVDAAAVASLYTDGAAKKGLIIQRTALQSANLFEVQSESGALLGGFNSNGGLVLGLTTLSSTASVSRSISLPDASGTVCLSSTVACGYIQFASGSFQTDAGTSDTIAINKTGASGNILSLQKNGGAVFTVSNTGALQIQSTDSTALDIRNIGGTSYFSVDTSTGMVQVGPTTADANGVLFVLDTKNTAGDPSGTNGGLYYNSADGKLRCFEGGEWKNCVTDNPVGLVAVRTSDSTAIGTAETQVLGYTIPSNSSVAGDTYRIRAYTSRAGGNNTAPTIHVRVGATTLTGAVAATLTGLGNNTAASRVYEGFVTIRSTGVAGTVGGGLTEYANNAGNLTSTTSPVTMNTTQNNIIELTFASGNANNTYTFTYVTIEKMSNQ